MKDDAIERLVRYERGRSKEPYNEQNKDARFIRLGELALPRGEKS